MIKVLVVEDSPTTLKLLTHLLTKDSEIKIVGQAENGLRAIELAAQLRPDVITMDVVMPDMDGVTATKKIMNECPTRIIMVTAYADSGEPQVAFESLKAGALEIVAKPEGLGKDSDDSWGKNLIDTIKAIARLDIRPLVPGECSE